MAQLQAIRDVSGLQLAQGPLTTTVAPPVPLPREARPQTVAPVAPAAPVSAAPKTAKLSNGKTVEIGKASAMPLTRAASMRMASAP